MWASRAGRGVTLSTHLDTVLRTSRLGCDGDRVKRSRRVRRKRHRRGDARRRRQLANAGEQRVDLLFVVGEEKGSDGARAANHLTPTSKFLVNGEPTESKLASGAKGSLRVTVRTQAAPRTRRTPTSASRPSRRCSSCCRRSISSTCRHEAILGETTVNVGTLRARHGSQHRSSASRSRAHVSSRRRRGAIRKQIEKWAKGRAELEYGSYIPAQHFHTIPGFEVAPVAYTSESRCLGRWGTPLMFGPGSIHVAHTPGRVHQVEELRARSDTV